MAEAFKGSERVEAKKESRDFSSELKIWENLSGGSPGKISTKPALGPVGKVEFTLGKDARNLSDGLAKMLIKSGKASVTDTSKSYLDLNRTEQMYINHIILLMIKVYDAKGVDRSINDSSNGLKFSFDFDAAGPIHVSVKHGSEVVLENSVLDSSAHEKVVAETHVRVSNRMDIIKKSTATGSIWAVMKSLDQGGTLEARSNMLQGLDVFDASVDPEIRADTEYIDGINTWMKVLLESGKYSHLSYEKLEINADGTGYTGHEVQNLAWVLYIRVNQFGYDVPDTDWADIFGEEIPGEAIEGASTPTFTIPEETAEETPVETPEKTTETETEEDEVDEDIAYDDINFGDPDLSEVRAETHEEETAEDEVDPELAEAAPPLETEEEPAEEETDFREAPLMDETEPEEEAVEEAPEVDHEANLEEAADALGITADLSNGEMREYNREVRRNHEDSPFVEMAEEYDIPALGFPGEGYVSEASVDVEKVGINGAVKMRITFVMFNGDVHQVNVQSEGMTPEQSEMLVQYAESRDAMGDPVNFNVLMQYMAYQNLIPQAEEQIKFWEKSVDKAQLYKEYEEYKAEDLESGGGGGAHLETQPEDTNEEAELRERAARNALGIYENPDELDDYLNGKEAADGSDISPSAREYIVESNFAPLHYPIDDETTVTFSKGEGTMAYGLDTTPNRKGQMSVWIEYTLPNGELSRFEYETDPVDKKAVAEFMEATAAMGEEYNEEDVIRAIALKDLQRNIPRLGTEHFNNVVIPATEEAYLDAGTEEEPETIEISGEEERRAQFDAIHNPAEGMYTVHPKPGETKVSITYIVDEPNLNNRQLKKHFNETDHKGAVLWDEEDGSWEATASGRDDTGL